MLLVVQYTIAYVGNKIILEKHVDETTDYRTILEQFPMQ